MTTVCLRVVRRRQSGQSQQLKETTKARNAQPSVLQVVEFNEVERLLSCR